MEINKLMSYLKILLKYFNLLWLKSKEEKNWLVSTILGNEYISMEKKHHAKQTIYMGDLSTLFNKYSFSNVVT